MAASYMQVPQSKVRHCTVQQGENVSSPYTYTFHTDENEHCVVHYSENVTP